MPWRRSSGSGGVGPAGPQGVPGFGMPGPPGEDADPPILIPGTPGIGTPGAPGADGQTVVIPGPPGEDADPPLYLPGPPGIGTPGAAGAAGLTIPGPQGDDGESGLPFLTPPENEVPIAIRNGSIASQGPGFATDTYLTDSSLFVPSGGGLQVRTMFRWKASMSKTAAGIAAPTAIIRIGTAGAIGDAAIITFTGAAQTGVIDTGTLEILAILRSVGAAGVLQGACELTHLKGAGAGLQGIGGQEGTSAGFVTTTIGLFAGLSLNFGASVALTVTQVQAEMVQTGPERG